MTDAEREEYIIRALEHCSRYIKNIIKTDNDTFVHLHEIRSQYMMKKIRKGSVERMSSEKYASPEMRIMNVIGYHQGT